MTAPWPVWAPYAAAASAAVNAAAQAAWALTGTAVPATPHHDHPPAAQFLLALLSLLAAAACLAGTERPTRVRAALVIAPIPIFVPGMIGFPLHFVTLLSGGGVESATGLAHVLLSTATAAFLALCAVAYHRRSRGRCPRCGRAHGHPGGGPLAHPAPSTASRRTRTAVYALMCGVLPWAGVKTVWTLGGDALGVTAEEWRAANAGASGPARALAAAGIDVTVLAAMVAILLLLALMYPWGMAFPRRIPVLAGRRVPRQLPLVPARLTAASLALYGTAITAYAPLAALGALPAPEPSGGFDRAGLIWMTAFGGLAFAGLGHGLIIASRSYSARTRPACAAGPANEVTPRPRSFVPSGGTTTGGGSP
ncbi:hypothetical protein [Spirillospora sp. NPDC029432]|uniref:hypothetical protein n=1 Tax=Spirillospora sp. NPDC029432 TaxID=3154599 RepID=UPI003454BE3C